MDTNLVIAQQVPIIILMVATFSLIEAAGEADYKPLKGTHSWSPKYSYSSLSNLNIPRGFSCAKKL